MARQRQKAKTAAAIKMVVDIKPGRATPAQLRSWHNFWRKVIGEMKRQQ